MSAPAIYAPVSLAIFQNRDFKESVRVVTAAALPTNTRTGNILTASANGSLNSTGVDGVTTLVVGERMVVKNEVTGANNGPYVITSLGSVSTPWVLTRATDADTSAKVTSGMVLYASQGTANGGKLWALTTADPITLNTTALTFAVAGGAVTSLTGTAGQITVSASTGAVTLSLPSALTGINSITSAAGQAVVIATGTSGTAISIASATNIVTFSAGIVGTTATLSSITAPTNTTLTLATLDNNKNIVFAPHGTGKVIIPNAGVWFTGQSSGAGISWSNTGYNQFLITGDYVEFGVTRIAPKDDLGSYMGESNRRWSKLYVGPNGFKIGDGTNGVTFATSGSSPNESLAITVPGTGELSISSVIANAGGNKRVTTQFDVTSSTALANVTGLSITLKAGSSYRFRAVLFTTSNVAGGVQFAIAGTATATNVVYEAHTISGAVIAAQTRSSAMAGAVGGATAVTAAMAIIEGTIAVNAAGTLTVQFAQNASNGSASSVLVGSYLEVFGF